VTGEANVEQQGSQRVIADSVIASVAAHAAAHTPGVVRLEGGVAGLVHQLTRLAGRAAGRHTAPSDGVDVRSAGAVTTIHVDIVVTGDLRAAAVAAAVQHSVATAVVAATGLPRPVVSVSILDIELPVVRPVWS
jgi:uncharacterized alkaline shock family protein YloU